MNTVRKMTDNTSKLNLKKLTFIVIVIWIILGIIFGLYDLAISIAVVDEASIWGNFGADYGETPGYGLIAIALSMWIGGYIKNLKMQKIPSCVIIVIGLLFIIFGDDVRDFSVGLSMIIPVILLIIFFWNKDLSKYRSISAVISLLAILNPLLFVQITKILCGRIRFSDLTLPGYTDFTPWFLPPGLIISPKGRSFPSGHTSMSFMFIPLLIPLSKMLIEKSGKKLLTILLIILVIGWALYVGVSRVIIGAHYASDVLFSGGAASIITILLYEWIYVKKANHDNTK